MSNPKPFDVTGFPAPFGTGAMPADYTGTLTTPTPDGLLLQAWEGGVLCSSSLMEYPDPRHISGGFNAVQHAAGMQNASSIIASQHPQFPNMQQRVATRGDAIITSRTVSVVSFGKRRFENGASGYFDLGVVDVDGNCVIYADRNAPAFIHSGDTENQGNLVHSVQIIRPTKGVVLVVGYECTQLVKWHGSSPGLYILDFEKNESTFVPLDLAQMTVRDNTMTVPLWFEPHEDGMCFYVPKPEELVTGKSNTDTANRSSEVTGLLRSMRIPDQSRQPAIASGGSVAAVSAPVSDAVSAAVSEEGFPPHNGSPMFVTTCGSFNARQFFDGANETLFVGRSVTRIPPAKGDPLFPLLFSQDFIKVRETLIRRFGIAPNELEHLMSKRNIVFVLDGQKGLDPVFLKARSSRSSSSSRTRIDGVFIIEVDSKEAFAKTDMSFISDIAGHRSTIVFQTKDGKYYFYWGTPQSVILSGIVPQSMNFEWLEFPALLSAYLASCPEHHLVKIEDPESTPILLGQYSVTFSTLPEFLELIQTSELSPEQQFKMIQEFFQFEFLLDEKKIGELKKMIKANFKTIVKPLDQMEILKRICEEGRASKQVIGTIRQNREAAKEAMKGNDRVANLFMSRLLLTVDTFQAKFQENLAGSGQKAQERMLAGKELHTFAQEATLEEFFAELEPHIDECILFQIGRRAFERSFLHHQFDPSLAIQNPRLGLLDSSSIQALSSLEVDHDMKQRDGIPIMVPFKQGYSETVSFLALPVFKEKRPDFKKFHVGIWGHLLKHGIKNLMVIPRDHKFAPRELEFKLIEMLLFILELLCSNRSSPVVPDTPDADDVLVCHIRSVWWLIYSVMFMNVGLTTAEPLSVVMFSNDIKDAKEVSFVIRMIRAFPKTGLNSEYLNVQEHVTEIFMRGLYGPFEDRIKVLASAKKVADQKKSAAQKAVLKASSSSFYNGAFETTSDKVTPYLRPKCCNKCYELKTVHDFPRSVNTLMFVNDKKQSVRLVTDVCFKCQGHPEPEMVCPREMCSKKGQPRTRFDIISCNNQGSYSSPCCYDCMFILIPKPLHRKRLVPPKYFKYFKMEKESSALAETGSTAMVVSPPPDTRLDVSSIWSESEDRIVGIEQIETLKIGTPVPIGEFISLAKQFGLLSDTEDVQITQQELTNLVCMILQNFEKIPAWKDAVPHAMDGTHKVGRMTPSEIVFRVSSSQGAIAGLESSDDSSDESSGAMVESSKKKCAMM